MSAAVAEGDLRKLVLILGILTVHSFPEGVAIGVSFADLGLGTGLDGGGRRELAAGVLGGVALMLPLLLV